MSEEILRALTQLFAIITKQDGGVTENERQFVIRFFQQELDHDSLKEYIELYDQYSGYNIQQEEEDSGDVKVKLTSVKDSVKTLGICRKINKTLTQKQKVIVVIKLLEMVGSDKNFTPQRMEIITTASTVFNIVREEYKQIETFVIENEIDKLAFSTILVANSQESIPVDTPKHIHTPIHGELFFLHVKSVDLYFVRYAGEDSNSLNGFTMQPGRVYLYSPGSTVKTQSGGAIYYSDLVADFNEEIKTTRLSFNANIQEFRFQNGSIGLKDVLIAEGPGKLIGIMGASGAGKTTLLNVLAGLEKPTKGNILINGFDLHLQKQHIHGVIGYVSQDDLLIEELTVYENLYFNSKLCFSDFTEEEINNRVIEVLESLGLDQRKDLKVGNALDKTISGGQRKRLNIALELIREPAILFLDEPTSGLSSRDSENVIDLLKELSLKGKLIFVVIHQPSSDIYKMFDKMIIMDTGGYPAYNGPPVDAVTYFKKAAHQVDGNRGQCETCGNVNPELIFSIIEAKVVDEYGQPTNKRKVTPTQWHGMYKEKFNITPIENVNEVPAHSLSIPGKIHQAIIFGARDVKAKLSNKQYLLINLLEAPLLAFILSFIIRYKSAPGGEEYLFRFNDNFPAFLLMGIIVALFMGLTVSAEEIIRDRKILRRESFLNLSWSSYLLSKLGILFTLSAIQTLLFVIVGNSILEIHGMLIPFWLVLFSTSCFANVVGLNISSAFNSPVTVYVTIPLLLIPQMILSGVLFNFDKLNELISVKGKVPIIADLMAARWAYEAMAVYQFKNNEYENSFYDIERSQAQADFKSSFLVEELKRRNTFLMENVGSANDSIRHKIITEMSIIFNSISREPYTDGIEKVNLTYSLTPENYTKEFGLQLDNYFDTFKKKYQSDYNEQANLLEKKMTFFESRGWNINENKNLHFNESLSDLVRNINTTSRLIEYEGKIIQEIDPIFQTPKPKHLFDYRTAFFLPEKNAIGLTIDTYWFNLMAIWVMSLVFFVALYFELLRHFLITFENIGTKTLKKTVKA